MYCGEGIDAIPEKQKSLFHTVDSIYVCKEKCVLCFMDSRSALDEDFEEKDRFEAATPNTILFYLYFEGECQNKYHGKHTTCSLLV